MVKKIVCYKSDCIEIEVEDGKDVHMIVKDTCPLPSREKLEEIGKALTHPEAKIKVEYEPIRKKKE